MCRALGVSRSGYYGWSKREPKPEAMGSRVAEVFWRHSRRYGSRRIVMELKDEGETVSRVKVQRLMRQMSLRAIQPRRFVPRTTDSRHGQQMSPNLLRDMRVDRPRQALVGDITYLPLAEGKWAYLATWMDLFSRKIVGWRISQTMTADLVTGALAQFIRREPPASGLIVHSDRGGQYVAAEFRQMLKRAGFRQSMSRAAESYDNSHAESLWSRLKAEVLDGAVFADFEQARSETFAWIEGYYNRVRRHSALGYRSPDDFERAWFQLSHHSIGLDFKPGKEALLKQLSCPLQ
jgi:putative transposase